MTNRFRSLPRAAAASAGLVLLLSGCSAFRRTPPPETRIDALRVAAGERQTIRIDVSRPALDAALARGDLVRSIRLVPVLRPDDQKIPYPEYRVFDVKPGSVYELLGLRDADLLVAANGYVIRDPRKFPVFVSLLRGEESGSVEIVRSDKPILFEYKIH